MLNLNRAHLSKLGVLLFLLLVTGVTGLILTGLLFGPMLFGATPVVEKPEDQKARLPDYDYTLWHELPVQTGGRIMPFETACIDVMRQITGRAKFEKQDPVAVVLSWMMYHPAQANPSAGYPDWDNYPFILCDYQPLREQIFSREDLFKNKPGTPTEQQLHGKYLTPNEVRDSRTLRTLSSQAMQERQKDRDKGQFNITPLQQKAEEVVQRLLTFESIIPLESAPRHSLRPRRLFSDDPFRFVLLNKVSGGSWLALGQLRDCLSSRDGWFDFWSSGLQDREGLTDPAIWQAMMKDNIQRMPHLYLPPDRVKTLEEFQAKIKKDQEATELSGIKAGLDERVKGQVATLAKFIKEQDRQGAVRYILSLQITEKDLTTQMHIQDRESKAPGDVSAPNDEQLEKKLVKAVENILQQRVSTTKKAVDDLQRRIDQAQAEGYNPKDDRYRDLHLTYLELRFPNIYKESVDAQKFPLEDVQRLTAAQDLVQQAYASGNGPKFTEASQAFAKELQEVSRKYEPTFPIVDTLQLEMRYNRVEPFRWAWVSMLGAIMLLSLGMGTGWRWLRWSALVPLAVSLGFQFYAYYVRIAISGRPPVTNMYETVVFVATMSVIFSLILEFVYRKGYILLAGMIVGTIGLVLADQLPTGSGFDSRISPLNPVLRSNFWLIIHVLTIVASYAAGTLAWGLGNLMLAMYLFKSQKHEHLKMMSSFCYRAMQIAVLLLAAGTFLGGWWAAESWGRFWGFDPKENFALLALIVYVIPLHMRYMGWVKDFGMAVAAVLCYAAIFMSWYGVNFILPAGLHSYGFGGGGTMWAFWAGTLNLEFLFLVWFLHTLRQARTAPAAVVEPASEVVRGGLTDVPVAVVPAVEPG
jgi:ABC-type transport system involved in cytochrome c biogenesis permease subunit